MSRRFPRSRPGDAITAAHENDVVREVERLGRLTVGPGLELRDNAGGRQIRDVRKRKIPVILSGSASPYSWVEVVRSGSAWATLAGGQAGTSNAVELNGVTGLAGKFARIQECGRSAVGAVEYCFQQVKRGAVACTATLTVTARGCNNNLIAGATITATLTGQTPVTGTTNASGVAVLTLTAAGTWSVSGSKLPRNATQTGTVAVTCGGSPTLSLGFLPAAAGYACTGYCADALPTTIYVTDSRLGGGPFALTYQSGFQQWIGCRTTTVAGVRDSNCKNPASRVVPVTYRFAASGVNGYSLQVNSNKCTNASGFDADFLDYLQAGDCSFNGEGASLSQVKTQVPCYPLAVTFNPTVTDPMTAIYSPGDAFVLSE